MRPVSPVAFFIGAVLTVVPAAAQRTWIVSANGGPGVDFTDIPPAIAIANPGDRIEVRLAAAYSQFTVYKALDIEAVGGATVPTIVVSGVSAGGTARVAGFVVASPEKFPRVLVLSCAGPVVLARLTIHAGMPNFGGREHPALEVSDSAAVLLLDSVAEGQAGSTGGAAPGVRLIRGALTVQRSTLRGGPGGATASLGGCGGEGLVAVSSSLVVSESSVEGGDGNFGNVAGGDGGAAVSLSADSAGLASASTLVGGAAGGGLYVNGSPGAAAAGPLKVGQDCVITGALEAGAVFVPAPTVLHSPANAHLGTTATLTLLGPPGTVVAAFVAFRPAHLPVTGILGAALLDLHSAFPWTSVTLSASGSATLALSVPADPWLSERDVFVQGLAAEPGGRITLTALGDLRLR